MFSDFFTGKETIRTNVCIVGGMASKPTTDGRRERGQKSRKKVLEAAVQLASTDGLTGLRFGVLALLIDVPKSSISALFKTKEQLQLATIDYAADLVNEQVMMRAQTATTPLGQLELLGTAWFDYLEGNTFEGGCFFVAAAAEMDGQVGAVRDAIAEANGRWLAYLALCVDNVGIRTVDGAEVAFRLNSAGLGANFGKQLLDDAASIERGRRLWADEVQRLRDSQ